VIDILIALQEAGYEVSAEGSDIRLRWQRQEPPRRELVQPLLVEATCRKPDILAALATVAGTGNAGHRPSPAATTQAPTPAISNAAHRDRQEGILKMPGPIPDEKAEALRATNALDHQTSGAHEIALRVDRMRCGWCGSTQLWPADTGSGRIYCQACHGVYKPSKGYWSPGEAAKRQNMGTPPAPSPADTLSDAG
jgi:hypothetical protein